MSSSAGRLFDAVAACLGICPDGQSFEGEAAMRLEALARRAVGKRRFSFDWANELPAALKGELTMDRMFHGLRRGMQAGDAPEDLAYGFHIWLARVISLPARHLVHTGQAEGIAYSGGCLQNRLLALMLLEMNEDIPDMFHSKTPANDGGLALGQAVIAAARWVRAR
jgi:hydrogenase maturation protein HypF